MKSISLNRTHQVHPTHTEGQGLHYLPSWDWNFHMTHKHKKPKPSYIYNSRMYRELPIKEIQNRSQNEFPKALENSIILGTCEKMKPIPDNSVQLVITSPPYNAGKEYDEDMSLDEYLAFLKGVFTEVFRVTTYGGRVCVNMANLGRKPYIPLSDYLSLIMIDIGFLMRGEIIWHKGSAVGNTSAWGSWKSASNPALRCNHEYIQVYSKGIFGRDKKGRVDTISKDDFLSGTKSIWNIRPVGGKRINHPAPFPIEIPQRLIQMYSFEKDIVLDPFMGSGQTALAALASNRKFVGYEIYRKYVELAEHRIAEWISEEQVR